MMTPDTRLTVAIVLYAFMHVKPESVKVADTIQEILRSSYYDTTIAVDYPAYNEPLWVSTKEVIYQKVYKHGDPVQDYRFFHVEDLTRLLGNCTELFVTF